MSDWTTLDWIGVVGVIAGVIGTYIAWRSWRGGPGGGTRSKVTVRDSPSARAAGRDMGVTRNRQTPTRSDVEVEDSEGAEAAGRDLKR